MAVTMQYGSYMFEPVPFINIQENYLKSGDGITRGVTFSLTINGTLAHTNVTSGIKTLADMERELREAFDRDGKYFAIKCDDQIILETYPRIVGGIQLSPSPDNWVFTIPYSITIEYETDPVNQQLSGMGEHEGLLHPPYISSFDEDWSVEFAPEESSPYSGNGTDINPYLVRFTHNISAVGKSHYVADEPSVDLSGVLEMPAWQQARNYISGYLGFDQEIFYNRIGLNLPTGSGTWAPYDHFRVVSVGETAGSYSVQESWLVLGSRGGIARKAIEDFTIDVQFGQGQELNTVAVQGSIRGLEERTYGNSPGDFQVTGTKIANARNYFNSINSSVIYSRATAAASAYSIGTLNTAPLIQSVGESPNQGIISYNYNYDTRPQYCLAGSIAGLKAENIQVSDTHPTEIFASLAIPGRSKGPILQSFNTISEATRTVTVDLLVSPYTGCSDAGLGKFTGKTHVDALISGLRDDWKTTYDRVFTTQNTETWSPKTGRYSRNVAWIGTYCNNTP